jgi:putative sterol carrier protein
MAVDFPSEEWIEAWQRVVSDSEYTEKGEGWGVGFNGDIVFHVVSDDRLPEDRYFFAGLRDGEVTDCREIDDPREVHHGFVLRAPYSDWVAVTEGEIGAVDGLMSGRFEMDGDMQRVLEHSESAAILVDCAAEVETEYRY